MLQEIKSVYMELRDYKTDEDSDVIFKLVNV